MPAPDDAPLALSRWEAEMTAHLARRRLRWQVISAVLSSMAALVIVALIRADTGAPGPRLTVIQQVVFGCPTVALMVIAATASWRQACLCVNGARGRRSGEVGQPR